MNLQHIIKINSRLHEVQSNRNNILTLGADKQRAILYLNTGKMVSKHVLTGKFRGERVQV